MADMLEKIKSSVNRGVTSINVKASSSIEKSKLRTHIETLERDIEKLEQKAGITGFEIWKQAGDYALLDETFRSIQQKKEEIEALKAQFAQIDELNQQILGTAERGNTPAGQAAPVQENPSAAPAQPTVFCVNCGTGYVKAPKFCTRCGCKMEL